MSHVLTFEDLGPGVFECSGTARMFEVGGTAPLSIVRTDQACYVEFDWQANGWLCAFLPGEWQLRVHLESIGPGPDYTFGPATVPFLLSNPADYPPTRVNIGAGAVVPGSYRMVASILSRNGTTPLPVAGYLEGPIVQFMAV